MKYNLPTLDHSRVKKYTQQLAIALACQAEMYNEAGIGTRPDSNCRMALLAMEISKGSSFTAEEFNQFTSHADLFHQKENDLEEHPYSFTTHEHMLFNVSHSLVSDIIKQHPLLMMTMGTSHEERANARKAAEMVLENF